MEKWESCTRKMTDAKRRRVKGFYENKRWTFQESKQILTYMQKHRRIEKPTAQAYYRKFLEENPIENATWLTIKFKIRHLKASLQRAIDWQKSISDKLEYDEQAVRKKMLNICPHFDQLADLFGKNKEELAQLETDSTSDVFPKQSDNVYDRNRDRISENEAKQWTNAEINKIILYMQKNRNFEKPSALVYYSNLMRNAAIYNTTWVHIKDKVHELQDNLQKAIDWQKSTGSIVRKQLGEVAFREKMLQMYPHFDQLYDLFGTDIEAEVECPFDLSDNIEITDCDVFMIQNDSDEEQKKWTDDEINKILSYIQTHRNFEKPTANVFYSELMEETAISDVTWLTIQSKVRELKDTLQKAIDWHKTFGVEVKNNYGESGVREKMLQICPYFDQLSVVFDANMKAEVVWLETPVLSDNNTESVFDDPMLMSQTDCVNDVQRRRRSGIRTKRWSDVEISKILKYMQNHRDVEKPTAYLYYTKMMKEITLKAATPFTIRHKMRNLKVLLQRAINWRKSNGAKVRHQNGESAVRENILRICPHYDQLLDLFGSNNLVEMTELKTPVLSDNEAVETDNDAFLIKNDSIGSFTSDVEESTMLPSINFGKTVTDELPNTAEETSTKTIACKNRFQEKQLQLEIEKFKWMKRIEKQKLEKQFWLEESKFEWMKKLEEKKLEREIKLETDKFEWMKKMEEKKIQNDFELKKLEIVQKERLMRHEIEMKLKRKD